MFNLEIAVCPEMLARAVEYVNSKEKAAVLPPNHVWWKLESNYIRECFDLVVVWFVCPKLILEYVAM